MSVTVFRTTLALQEPFLHAMLVKHASALAFDQTTARLDVFPSAE